DVPTHAALTEHLDTINVIGRSEVSKAKFDMVMLREIADLPGINHTVTGFDPTSVPEDARARMVTELAARALEPNPRLTSRCYFAHTPQEGVTSEGVAAALTLANGPGGMPVATDSIITAIGCPAGDAEQLPDVDEEARSTCRV